MPVFSGYYELCYKQFMGSALISFQVLVRLEGGIGVSLINKVPEELVFVSLTGINVHYTQLAASHMLELSIQDVQVDNQLIGTTQPFMLYVTPLSNENEVIETGPAVQVNAVKFPSKSALTNIYKVTEQTAARCVHKGGSQGQATADETKLIFNPLPQTQSCRYLLTGEALETKQKGSVPLLSHKRMVTVI
ncbi:hypothetical protein A6R68_13973 [Neotoma lepida]|uniref:Uncharacterized protein n=1 Tax=Neotoma lepida TaxID=56216 RepID=A0A1A6HAX9_NEOLE|nr:hypothetical protein A6R68_13973 [Neotoma lepida]